MTERDFRNRLQQSRRWRLLAVLGPTWAVLGLLFLWPIGRLILGAFRSSPLSPDADWTLAGLPSLLAPEAWHAFGVSLLLGLVSTVAGILIAVIFAFLSERSDAPFRRLITPAMLIMYATPSLFYAMGFSLLGNPYTGLVNVLFRDLTGTQRALVDVETLTGLIAVTTFRVVAFSYIFVVAGFRAIDATLEDASLASGVSRFRTLWKIDLPLLLPAITGAALIAVIAGLHTFDIAMILVEPVQIRTVATHIFHIMNKALPPDFTSASMIGSVVVVLAFALGYLQYRLLGGRSFVTVGGKGGRSDPYRLGRWRWAAGAFILTYLLVVEVLPILTLIHATFQPFPGVYSQTTLVHYQRSLAAPETLQALSNTVVLALSVGFAATALAFWVSHLSQHLSHWQGSLLRLAATIPFALPGVVAAIAITSAFITIPGLRQLYGTLALMGIGLIVAVIPQAVQLSASALAQISPDLRQAAQVHGARPWRSFTDITLPLIAPQFLFGWFIAGVSVAGNLDIPLMLGGPGLTTVAARVLALNSYGRLAEAAVLLLLLVGLIVIAGLLGWLGLTWARRRRGGQGQLQGAKA